MKMTGNTILITGGTSGIGRELAVAFYEYGNHVIITGRSQSRLDETLSDYPGLSGFILDVGDLASLDRLSDKVHAEYPDLNVIIANAGISRPEDITDDGWDSADAEAIISTNITGVVRVIAAFLPLLKHQSDSVVMATSSALAFLPLATFPTYCASKAFLHSWLTSVRHQLRDSNIEVLELSPPYVQTSLTGIHQSSDPRAMPVGDYIRQVMKKLEQEDYSQGEILLEQDLGRRWAERNGTYDSLFNQMNP